MRVAINIEYVYRSISRAISSGFISQHKEEKMTLAIKDLRTINRQLNYKSSSSFIAATVHELVPSSVMDTEASGCE